MFGWSNFARVFAVAALLCLAVAACSSKPENEIFAAHRECKGMGDALIEYRLSPPMQSALALKEAGVELTPELAIRLDAAIVEACEQ